MNYQSFFQMQEQRLTELNKQASKLDEQGKYSEAVTFAEKALALTRQLRGQEHPSVATSLNNLAGIYESQGRYAEAEPLYVQALELNKRLLGQEHPLVAASLNNLAYLYQAQGHYEEAEPLYMQALELSKRLLGQEHPDVARSLNNLATLYHAQGRYMEAEPLLVQALALWKCLLGQEHPHVANSLNNLAELYRTQGCYMEAEPLYVQALELRKRLLGQEHPDIAASLNNLAELYSDQGRYMEAEPLYVQALALWKRLLGQEHPHVATSLNNLAGLYRTQGRYEEAEPLYLQALALWKRLLGENHPDIATSLNNLAGLYRTQGRYEEAEPLYLQALELRKRSLGENHPDIATSLNNLALLYHVQGRYNKAEPLLVQALELRKRLLGENHPDIATSLNNLAGLYRAQGRYDKAEPLYLQALELSKRLLGQEHPDVARSLNNLAELYSAQGRYIEAEPLYVQALLLNKRLLGENHPDVAANLNNLAALYQYQGRYDKAEPLYVQALALWKRLLGQEHPDIATSLNNLAGLFAAINRQAEALVYMCKAAKIENRLISQVFAVSSEKDRLAYLQTIRANFEKFLSLVWGHLRDSPRAKQVALDLVLRRKALTASALAAQNEALYSGRYPHLTDQFQQLRSLSDQIIHLYFSPPSQQELTTTQQQLAQLQAQYDQLERNLASQVPEIKLQQQLAKRDAIASALPVGSTLVEFVRFDIYDFQAVPARGESYWQPARYVAFILPAGQPDQVHMVDLGEAKPIDRLIQVFRQYASDGIHAVSSLEMGGDDDQPEDLGQLPAEAIQLRQAIFDPIRPYLGSHKQLLLAPDGNLNLVPFGILPSDETGQKLLRDEYSISYLSVGRDILRSKIQTTRPASPPLIIADPDFNLKVEPATVAQPAKPKTRKTRKRLTHFVRRWLRLTIKRLITFFVKRWFRRRSGYYRRQTPNRARVTLSPLQPQQPTPNLLKPIPGTRFLAEEVAKRLGVSPYLGTEALESHLTTRQSPSILLIATHGFFRRDSPHSPPQPPLSRGEQDLFSFNRLSGVKVANPMLRSGLAFAGANAWLQGKPIPNEAGKGLVFAQDVAALDLWATELAVLSACNTAIGDIKIGEGVFGLRRAFAVAGAKTLVMSLWSVPDRATALLMERFFTNLRQGLGRADALQDAQNYIRTITLKELQQSPLGRSVLEELKNLLPQDYQFCQDDRPLEHPYFWGAWVCQGDTTPMKKSEGWE